MRPLDAEMIEERERVGDEARHIDILGARLRPAVSARVVAQDAEAAAERRDLRVPEMEIAGERVAEGEPGPGSGAVEPRPKLDAVDADAVLAARRHGAAQPGSPVSGTSPAALIPATAQSSSFAEVSPLMPTEPTISPAWSRTSTPPGTGTMRPSARSERAEKKPGTALARRSSSRPPKPMPSAPQALPMAI